MCQNNHSILVIDNSLLHLLHVFTQLPKHVLIFCYVFLNAVTLVNDTIIGDPQFTVALSDGSASLCYEIHGGAGKYFNIISDTCTSVNSRFSVMERNPKLNAMTVIGIYAATSATPNGDCAEIAINVSGCTATLDGIPVELVASVDDIRIRKFNNGRWRVSVPNCERPSAVMWVTCENDMLRFRIARGSNLTPTSHGLLGNFKTNHNMSFILMHFQFLLSRSILEYTNRHSHRSKWSGGTLCTNLHP